jgi:NitT/TauT family transport system substrate-binding protein
MRRTTRATGVAASLAALLVLVAPGAATARADAALTTVHVVALPVEPAALAFYAKDRGFFERQGIDARVSVLPSPQHTSAAVLSGNAQFSAFSVGGIAAMRANGAPVRLVASGALYRPSAPSTFIVAGKGKRITRARDLVGKTIAIDTHNSIAHVGLRRWLKRNGVAESRVRVVDMPFSAMVGPLSQGRRIDAAVIPEPFLTVVTQRGATRIAPLFNAVCARDCLLTIWLARRDIDPVVAARFRNAIQAAAVWANRPQNRHASAAILSRYTGVNRALLRQSTRTTFAQRLVPRQAQPWIDVYAEFGIIPSSFQAIDLTR